MQQFAAPVADPENPGRQLNGKAQPAGSRRALGDIGNLGNGLNQKLHVGKDGEKGRTGVLTRRAAAQLQASSGGPKNPQGNDSWGTRPRASLRPRDANVPVVSAQQGAKAALQPAAAAPKAVKIEPKVEPDECDIDSVDKSNPLAASDFVKHIFSFYNKIEPRVAVAADYMSRQTDINDKMRAILIDWLVDVHLKFKLMPETLFLTVNLIDRFLEVKQVTRKHLQLVGVTAMLVASKYEEIWAPEVRDFVYISDRAYNRDQILNMEKIMLNVLRFNLTVPTYHHFMHRYLKAAGVADDKEVVNYASYLMELALPDYSMLRFPCSKVAAAAVSVACSALNHEPHPRAFVYHSGYKAEDLRECSIALVELCEKAPNASLSAVFKKFSQEKYGAVATKESALPMVS